MCVLEGKVMLLPFREIEGEVCNDESLCQVRS